MQATPTPTTTPTNTATPTTATPPSDFPAPATARAGNGASSHKRRVLIVDDHPLVRSGLVELINQEMDLHGVGSASSADRAVEMVSELRPDLVLADLSLQQGGDGIELVTKLRETHEDLPILVYSMHDETLHAERALRAGASGYLMKSQPVVELLVAMRRVLEGQVYLSKAMATKLLHQNFAVPGGGSSEGGGETVDRLSEREFEVFSLIGRGTGTADIAEKLGLSIKTIETYREHIKRKLDIESGYALLRVATQWHMQQGHDLDEETTND